MRPEVTIALVFTVAIIWVGMILVLLSRLDRPERRALRQERRADRPVHQRLHRITRVRKLAHRRIPSRRGRSRVP